MQSSLIIFQFKLEDAEFAKTAALKAKQNIEMELSDVQGQLDDILRTKSDMDDKMVRMSREKADLSSQLEDAEEELQVSGICLGGLYLLCTKKLSFGCRKSWRNINPLLHNSLSIM